jgi:hypothetical protein
MELIKYTNEYLDARLNTVADVLAYAERMRAMEGTLMADLLHNLLMQKFRRTTDPEIGLALAVVL